MPTTVREPFHDDCFGRKQLVEDWTKLLLKDKKGTVISVDGGWGTGKTFLATNWHEMLKGKGYITCYIDVFEYDFTNDPFLVISSSIIEQFKNDTDTYKELKQRASSLFDKTKIVCSTGLNITGNFIPLVKGITNSIKMFKDAKDEWNKLSDIQPFSYEYDSLLKYVEELHSFKDILKKVCAKSTEPVVVFIDELDRCKPSFAVEFLEKLKHIFDIENLKFVLMVNMDELVNAVRGVYGAEINGSLYLNKFINIQLGFNYTSNPRYFIEFIRKYTSDQCDSEVSLKSPFLSEVILDIKKTYDLSLRDTQSIINLFGYIKKGHRSVLYVGLLLKAMKLFDNNTYRLLETKDFSKLPKDFFSKHSDSDSFCYLYSISLNYKYIDDRRYYSPSGERVQIIQNDVNPLCNSADLNVYDLALTVANISVFEIY